MTSLSPATWFYPKPGFSAPPPPRPQGYEHSEIRWYLESSLASMTPYKRYDLGEGPQLMSAGDIIEPYWVENQESGNNRTAAVDALGLSCLQCDQGANSLFWESCNNFTTGVIEVTKSFSVSAAPSKNQLTLIDRDYGAGNAYSNTTVYLCALQLQPSLEEAETDLDYQAFTRAFFARGSWSSDYGSVFNMSRLDGVALPDAEHIPAPAFVYPLPDAMDHVPFSLRGSPSYMSLQHVTSHRVIDALPPRDESLTMGRYGAFSMPKTIQAGDLLEPRWTENTSYPVTYLGLSCIVCLRPYERDPNQNCGGFVNGGVKEYHKEIEFSSPGGKGVSVIMPHSGSTATLSVCAFQLHYTSDSGSGSSLASSKIFFVNNTLPGRDQQNVYNITAINGTQTGRSRRDFLIEDIFADNRTVEEQTYGKDADGKTTLSKGALAGIVVGSIFGAVLIAFCCRCCGCGSRKFNMKESRPQREPADLSVEESYVAAGLDPRRRDRDNAARLDQARTQPSRRERTAAGTTGEPDIAKPPPAYHEVVTDQEQILAQYEIAQNSQPTPDYAPRRS